VGLLTNHEIREERAGTARAPERDRSPGRSGFGSRQRAGSASRPPCVFRTRCAPGRRALHKLEVFFSLDFDDEAHQIPSVYSMSKRRQNALFVVVGLALAAILISALRRREPVSEGKKLGEAAAKAGVK